MLRALLLPALGGQHVGLGGGRQRLSTHPGSLEPPSPSPGPLTSSGCSEAKESRVVSEETDREWKRRSPSRASRLGRAACGGAQLGQGPGPRPGPPHLPLPEPQGGHGITPPPRDPRCGAEAPPSHGTHGSPPAPPSARAPHPSGASTARAGGRAPPVQRLPHLLQASPLGRQRRHHAAERAVHCGDRGRAGGYSTAPPPRHPHTPLGAPSPVPPFWASSQKLRCSWLYSGGRLKGSWPGSR